MQKITVRDRILNLVNSNGPVLPVEISGKVGIDSLMANAYLSELVESGLIKKSEEKVGGTNLYFTNSQSSAASARLKELGIKVTKTVGMYKPSVEKSTPEVAAKRQAFSDRLNEIERREQRDMSAKIPEAIPRSVADEVIKRLYEDSRPKIKIIPKEPVKIEPIEPEIKEEPVAKSSVTIETDQEEVIIEDPIILEEVKPEDPKPEKNTQSQLVDTAKDFVKQTLKKLTFKETEFVTKSVALLTSKGAEIIHKELTKTGKEAEMIVQIESEFGTNKLFVALKNKKSVTEGDLSLVYSAALDKKLPALVITNGKLTKTAQDYLKTIGGLLKVKTL